MEPKTYRLIEELIELVVASINKENSIGPFLDVLASLDFTLVSEPVSQSEFHI